MHHSTTPTRPIVRTAISFLVLVFLAAACSSGSGSSDSAATSETVEVASTQAEDSGSTNDTTDSGGSTDHDCQTMEEHLFVLRNVTGLLPSISDQEMMDVLAIDIDAVEAAIEGLRPIQDIEGIFGTSRETLDNFAMDMQSLRDGQFGEMATGISVTALTAVVADEVCK